MHLIALLCGLNNKMSSSQDRILCGTNLPEWWPCHGCPVEGSGALGGGCSEGTRDSSISWRKPWASLELPGTMGHPAMPGQPETGAKVTWFAQL